MSSNVNYEGADGINHGRCKIGLGIIARAQIVSIMMVSSIDYIGENRTDHDGDTANWIDHESTDCADYNGDGIDHDSEDTNGGDGIDHD